MIQGPPTVVYKVPDLDKAKAWYARVPGLEPYFAEPFYVGFRVGGFELGPAPEAAPQDVGGGIRVASASDPFGNVLGIIENPHFSAADVR